MGHKRKIQLFYTSAINLVEKYLIAQQVLNQNYQKLAVREHSSLSQWLLRPSW